MRLTIGIISAVGTALFGLAFVVSFFAPVRVEAMARVLLQQEIEARATASLLAMERSRIVQFAHRLAEQRPELAEAARERLRARLVPIVEAVILEMRDPDCPCRRQLASATALEPDKSLHDALQSGRERLTGFIHTKYVETAGALLREFRIFTGANALMFVLLGLVLRMHYRARAHLLPATTVLLLTTVVVAGLYLFQQNWLHTIVFGDYVGWAYFTYLGIVGALLGDLLLNHGRVNARIVSTIGGVFGSGSLAPC